MKKTLAIITAALILSLCGCNTENKKTDETTVDSTTTEITLETENTSETKTQTDIKTKPLTELPEYEAGFFNALVDHDYDKLTQYLFCDKAAISFLDGVVFNDCALSEDDDYSNTGLCTVVLDVKESNSDIFPAGINTYYVIFDQGVGSVIYIGTSSDGEPLDIVLSPAENLCCQTSTLLNLYSTQESVVSYIKSLEVNDSLLYNLSNIVMCIPDSNVATTATKISEKCTKLFGDTGIDFTKYSHYDASTDELNLASKGGVWNFTKSNHNYEEKDGKTILTLDFYADTAYMVIAKTIEYTLDYEDEDNFKLLSTKVTYDSGFTPARCGI